MRPSVFNFAPQTGATKIKPGGDDNITIVGRIDLSKTEISL